MTRVRLLGFPRVERPDGSLVPNLGPGKPLGLLAVLALRGAVRRDEMVDLLWRDIEETKARNAFRQSLHRLRGALGEETIPKDADRLRLVVDGLSIDVLEFERALADERRSDAIALYAGDSSVSTKGRRSS